MPFFHVIDRDLDNAYTASYTELLGSLQFNQSVTIDSLLDRIPGHKFSTDDFFADMTMSIYYTPFELKQAKLDKRFLSTFHMNISSLQLHLDELRTLLKRVNFPFDVIGIKETRLPYGEKPQTDIEIPGYEIFTHTTSKTNCGGVGLYIKSGKFKKMKPRSNICRSIQKVAEARFAEATDLRNKE